MEDKILHESHIRRAPDELDMILNKVINIGRRVELLRESIALLEQKLGGGLVDESESLGTVLLTRVAGTKSKSNLTYLFLYWYSVVRRESTF